MKQILFLILILAFTTFFCKSPELKNSCDPFAYSTEDKIVSDYIIQSNPSIGIEVLQFLFPKQLVVCPTDSNLGPFTISGSITGLSSANLTIQSGTSPNETITILPGQTSYQFQTKFARNTKFQISVSEIPFGKCFVENGSGSIARNITNANIRCVEPKSFTGLSSWYRIDSLNLSDSTPVSTWIDDSINANTLTGGGPLFHTSGMNGFPEVRMIGNSMFTNSATGLGGSELTIFLVMRRLGFYATEQFVFFLGNDAGGCPTGSIVMSLQATSGEVGLQTPCSTYYLSPSPSYVIQESDLTPKLVVLRYGYGTPSSIYARLNGQVLINNTLAGATLNPTNAYFQFGDYGAATRPAQVAVSEYLYYNRVMPEEEIQKIECYLAKKYNFANGNSCVP
ncbi:hypothetical protein EHQ46_07710 [Leptospira yanagawae]|uniref:Ig-like domain-containing protein n=1 Tax=Leptospira yanagawae TaxID=293069 RepID=A0ABY2M3F8_9LEPT|nr:hypothetical protein [Leptospira yanagawae]TGL21729.1 hypothetical protein EHQ46_07710 [Leptospira yanagawae]